MKKFIAPLFFAVLLFTETQSFSKQENLESKLTKTALEAQEKFGIGALSLAVIPPEKDKPIFVNIGHTDLENHSKVTSNHLFQVGSLTKTFTAVLVLKAYQKNKLHLSDTLGQYFPEYAKWKNITISQLLNHTSGIYNYDHIANWWVNLSIEKDKIWTPEELVTLAYQHDDIFLPGKGWAYSNTNYVLLAMILEKVMQKPQTEIIQDFLNKQGLSNSYYLPHPYPKHISDRMVHGYYKNKYDQTHIHGSWIHSAGAMVSNPKDMAAWFSHLINNTSQYKKIDRAHMSFTNTTTGQLAESASQTAHRFGVFRMNTPKGIVYFTPGLTPGYTSIMVYSTCYNVYFAYTANKIPIEGLHSFMISQILNHFSKTNKNIVTNKNQAFPNLCEIASPSEKLHFPNFD